MQFLLLNFNAISFTAYRYILEVRELPVMSMFERIKSQIMHRHMTKKKEALQKWSGNITPKIRDKIRKNVKLSAHCHPEESGMGVFGVLSNEKTYIVELNMHTCTCRRWQLTGIPCSHACACCRHERIRPETMVSSCYFMALNSAVMVLLCTVGIAKQLGITGVDAHN